MCIYCWSNVYLRLRTCVTSVPHSKPSIFDSVPLQGQIHEWKSSLTGRCGKNLLGTGTEGLFWCQRQPRTSKSILTRWCNWQRFDKIVFSANIRTFVSPFSDLGLALLTLSWDKNWDSHSLVNGYPSFYPRIAFVAPSPGGYYSFWRRLDDTLCSVWHETVYGKISRSLGGSV